MGGSDNKDLSHLDRRTSLRASLRLSAAPGEDDMYDLAAIGVSDGFRPTNTINETPADAGTASSSSSTPPHAEPVRPSSIAKPPHRPHESFSLRNDGLAGPLGEGPSMPVRSSTLSTTSDFIRAESPYQGPSGPSHPYQMYPQDVRLARTASLATTSTVPVAERPYNGPSGPSHPYAMYPQGTVTAADSAASGPAQAGIQVGFAGRTDNYERRLGPDGEEVADMIGPDGHTEQLPPYSRYPVEAYARKQAAVEATSAGESSSDASAGPSTSLPVAAAAIPGAGGIGIATRNPEFASRDDLGTDSPLSRRSVRSFNSEGSHHDINVAAMGAASEKKPLKKWQIAAKRKVCGIIPIWVIALVVVVFFLMGLILGSVVGTILANRKPPSHDSSSSSHGTTTITYDATALGAIPTGLPALVEGAYALPLLRQQQPANCFNDSSQSQTWDCNIVFAQMMMNIKSSINQNSPSNYTMSLDFNDTYTLDKFMYSYGMQPPFAQDVPLFLVSDMFETSRGPAWSFEIVYNKTIIIPSGWLTPPSASGASSSVQQFKRGGMEREFQQKGIAAAGDTPWICHWDGTILEVFIYPSQNSSLYGNPIWSSVPSSSRTTTTPSSGTAWTPTARAAVRTDAGQVTGAYQTSTTTSSASAVSSNYLETGIPTPELPVYPRVVKVEERRMNGPPASQPYCQQVQVIQNGIPAKPVKDSSGNPVIVYIDENEAAGSSNKRAIGSELSNCGCLWYLN